MWRHYSSRGLKMHLPDENVEFTKVSYLPMLSIAKIT
jgi:hypothetical protein